MREIYLDNAASTPMDPRVVSILTQASIGIFGNPSNYKHAHGREAKNALDRARKNIGDRLGVDPSGLIFTSGATEANNLALRGISCLQKGHCSAIVSSIEHACVDQSLKFLLNRGVHVQAIPTATNGQIDVKALQKMVMNSKNLKLITVMSVNNETGVIQPLEEVVRVARWKGALVHTDAVQAIGKVNLKILQQVDMFSLSGHKINGPKGIGCLWVRPGLKISPLLVGGGQEFGIRSGTSPVPTILAFEKAVEIALTDQGWLKTVGGAIEALEEKIIMNVPGARINGRSAPRVPNISNISFSSSQPVIDKVKGVALSAGAACGCSKTQPSKVLLTMGVPETSAKNCIRVSAGRFNTEAEIMRAADIIIHAATS
jgi:cysteine desulfurase